MKLYISRILVIALVIGVFTFDLLTPLGYMEWIMHIIPFIIASRFINLVHIPYLSAAFTLFILTDILISPPGGIAPGVALSNRLFGIIVIWLMTYVILHRLRTEEKVRESEQRFKAVAESSLDAIILIDGKGLISYFNPAAESMFGYAPVEIIGKELHSFLVSKRARDEYYRGLPIFEKTGTCRIIGQMMELNGIRKGGATFPVELHVTSFRLGGVWHAAGTVRDISERKRLEEEIRLMAHHDTLTGLPNRRFFMDIAAIESEQARRYKKKMAILYLDIDKFKEINDALGHDAGDQVLKEVARRIKSNIRKSDTVARVGGDEFNILLPTFGDRGEVAVAAGKIVASMSAPCMINGHKLYTSASIGISIYPDDSENLNDLISYADQAMYAVKELGGNNYHFHGGEAARKVS